MNKISIIEISRSGKQQFLVKCKKEELGRFSTKELANECAMMYLVPPYTMQANVWYK